MSLSELQRVAIQVRDYNCYSAFSLGLLILAQHRGDGTALHAHNFLIGAAARVIASTVVAPITVLKTRLEASDSLQRSGLDITKQMLQRNALRSMFKGFIPTLCRDAPYSSYPSCINRFVVLF